MLDKVSYTYEDIRDDHSLVGHELETREFFPKFYRVSVINMAPMCIYTIKQSGLGKSFRCYRHRLFMAANHILFTRLPRKRSEYT